MIKKILSAIILSLSIGIMLSTLIYIPSTLAQPIPNPKLTNFQKDVDAQKKPCEFLDKGRFTLIPSSGCLFDKFRNGYFRVPDILLYLKYATEMLLILTSTASFIFIIIGGYQYLLSFVVEDKEGGKKTITYAIIGLAVSMMAWIIINSALYIISN